MKLFFLISLFAQEIYAGSDYIGKSFYFAESDSEEVPDYEKFKRNESETKNFAYTKNTVWGIFEAEKSGILDLGFRYDRFCLFDFNTKLKTSCKNFSNSEPLPDGFLFSQKSTVLTVEEGKKYLFSIYSEKGKRGLLPRLLTFKRFFN